VNIGGLLDIWIFPFGICKKKKKKEEKKGKKTKKK